MTDIEYDMFYNRKKKEIIDRLVGADARIPEKHEERMVLTKKQAEKTECHDFAQAREFARQWLAEYNESIRTNNGKNVTYVDSGLADEVPPPVK